MTKVSLTIPQNSRENTCIGVNKVAGLRLATLLAKKETSTQALSFFTEHLQMTPSEQTGTLLFIREWLLSMNYVIFIFSNSFFYKQKITSYETNMNRNYQK